MEHQTLFSIITPTYNREKLLVRAIESVLQQAVKNWEMLIVDDGSTDGTRDVVRGFPDARIRYSYQARQERSAARNRGIRLSSGEYVIFLDSDDALAPGHLECLAAGIADNSQAKILRTQFQIRREQGTEDVHLPLVAHPVVQVWKEFIPFNAYCLHRSLFDKAKFHEQFWLWEDKHLLLRLLLDEDLLVLDCCTAIVYDHPGRSVHVVDPHTFEEKLEQMPRAIDDLWRTHGNRLSPYLTERDLRKARFALAFGFATDAIRSSHKRLARRALTRALRYAPLNKLAHWTGAMLRAL